MPRSIMSSIVPSIDGADRRGLLVLAGVLAVAVLMMLGPDRWLSEALRTLDPRIIDVFRVLTDAGESQYFLVPSACAAVFLFVLRHRTADAGVARLAGWLAWALVFIFLSVALGGILVNLIKFVVGRARPRLLQQDGTYGFAPFSTASDFHSFPSGHTDTLVAVAVAAGFLVPRWRVALFVLGLFLSFSRVMVNAHYVGDVLGGVVVGIAVTWWLREVFVQRGLVWRRSRRGVTLRPAGRYLVGAKGLRPMFRRARPQLTPAAHSLDVESLSRTP